MYHGESDKNVTINQAKTVFEDLARRDLTMNSMALNPITNEIIDPFGGLTDIQTKTIRFTGNPNQRIYEDPCRIIRACRILAKIEGVFDVNTYRALCENVYLVRKIPVERIQKEILKAMEYKYASMFWAALQSIGALQLIFPELEKCWLFTGGKYHLESIWEHLMITGDSISIRYPLIKLAGYLHDVGKPVVYDGENFLEHEDVGCELVEKMLSRLRFSNYDIKFVTSLIKHHMRSASQEMALKGIRRTLVKLQEDGYSG